MRVGKKLNVVEAKKTRSCVVRLEKVRSPPPQTKQARGTATVIAVGRTRTAPAASEEKTLKGPLKKRPITQVSSSPVAATPKAKEKPKAPQSAAKLTKVTATPPAAAAPVDIYELPPTIAAGRSRRAIKPNPKYASEDMITPKIIKNVATLGSMSSSNKKNSTAVEKIRKLSMSSSDDFFNKESSDELDLDEFVDKAYNVEEKEDSDSDFSDLDVNVPVVVRKRGRPRKDDKSLPRTPQLLPKAGATKASVAATPIRTINATTTSSKPTPTAAGVAAKNTPSQLQILRKTLAANANRIGTQSGAMKRKLEPSNDDSEMSVSRKRFTLNTSGGQYKAFGSGVKEIKSLQQAQTDKTQQPPARKSLPSQTLNGSKLKHDLQATSDDDDAVAAYLLPTTPPTEKRRTLATDRIAQKPATKVMGPASARAAAANQTALSQQNRSASAKVQAAATGKQQRSSSPAIPKATAAAAATASAKGSPKATTTPADDNKKAPSGGIDDFETMPTFTIVNINDIINKKGDVLISKAAAAKNATSPGASNAAATDSNVAASKRQSSESPANERRASPSSAVADTKLSRRKPGHTNILSEKMDPGRRPKTAAAARTPLPATKKPTQTILNHTLANKSAAAAAANASMQRPKRGAAAMSKSNNSAAANKPAPRILNSMVAKKMQPVKPMIANLDDSADESFPLSLEDEDEEGEVLEAVDGNDLEATTDEEPDEEDDDDDDDDDDYEQEAFMNNAAKRRKLSANAVTPYGGGRYARKKTATGKAGSSSQPGTKENSLAANNRMTPSAAKSKTPKAKSATTPAASQQQQQQQRSKPTPPEKVVISRQGDKIIKKITCFETWYVINTPEERPIKLLRNQLEMPLIKLANVSKNIDLPSSAWSSKVTLYELSATTIAKSTLITYTGALREHNISEEDRAKYQPSCVMFRRAVSDRTKSRLPYDRAVIFKNKTFFTNIEGKNVKMIGAPANITSEEEIEILLQIVDSMTLQSPLVEPATTVQ